jgi:CBS domain containing-hemolysin-like protein
MDAYSWVGALLLAACIFLIIFVSAAAACLISLSRARVRLMAGRGIVRAEVLQRYMQEREAILGALALAHNLALVTVAALAAAVVTREQGHGWTVLVAVVGLALLGIGLLEAITRLVVTRHPEGWALRLAPFMGVFKFLFGVPARLMALPFQAVTRPAEADEEEEMLRLIELEEEEGDLEDVEKKMIRGVFGLEETTVREIMTPRIDIVGLDIESPPADAVGLIINRGFSRIPAYEGTVDKIVGIVYAKDLIRYLAAGSLPASLRDVARDPFYVPESKRVDDLLTDMRRVRKHIAIVVDEYGGTAGLATIEDLLEEIVGEIEDEHDEVGSRVQRISDTEVEFDGRVDIDELNDIFHTAIKGEEFDTVGGCVLHLLGKMPAVGDEAQTDRLMLRVVAIDGHRITRVRVTRAEHPADDGNGHVNGNTGAAGRSGVEASIYG